MTNLLLKRFVKNHTDTQQPAVRAAYGKLASIVGIMCNVLLCLAKLTLGFLFGAVSIVADGANNLSDASGSIITLLGFKLSEKPADEKHPYGHARLEYLSALGVAVLVLVIGVELVISSAKKVVTYFQGTAEAADLQHFWLVVIILVGSICVKLWLMLFYRRLGNSVASTALAASSADSRNDVISTTAVLAAYCLEAGTGWHVDGYIGILVALFILWSGVQLVMDAVSPLLGEAVSPELSRMVAHEIGKYDKVLGIHDLIVHDYGPGRRFASVHVEMDQREDVLTAHELIDEIESDFKKNHNISLVIHYDPIVTDDPELNRLHQCIADFLKQIDSRLRVHDVRMVRGSKRSNVIFDLELPFELKPREEEIHSRLKELIRQQDPGYMAVITTDYVT